MGTIRNGFWSLGFILSPNEFIDFVEYCTSLNIKFDRENVIKEYEMFYNALVAKTSPQRLLLQRDINFITLTSFVCMLTINGGIGISITPANQMWLDYGENAAIRISNWAIRINLQKGVSVDKEDDKGKYFVYDDIQKHSPLSYPLYQELTTWIKQRLNFYALKQRVVK